jgi:GNAT superfamily N-acetyltransferase
LELRPFRNSDPPAVCRLWDACGLGPGASTRLSVEEFDYYVLAQPHFAAQGLILAVEDGRVIGAVHACLPITTPGWEPRGSQGVISLVLVHPAYRRRGIGRQLVDAAGEYLCGRGCREVLAGETHPTNPFYLGLYGSAASAGFLVSDFAAEPFFKACGFGEYRRWQVLGRSLERASEPFDPRVVANRRKYHLDLRDLPPNATARWVSREGRLEGLWAGLLADGDPVPVASCTVWPMRVRSEAQGGRVMGVTELFVPAAHRRNALAKTLLLDLFRALRADQTTAVEMVVPMEDTATKCLAQLLGFTPVDTGIVYYRRLTEIVTPSVE